MEAPWAAGICSGIALHLGVSVTLVRIVFAVGTCIFGVLGPLYLWLWVMVPADDPQLRREHEGRLAPALVTADAEHARVTKRNQLLTVGVLSLLLAGVLFALLRLFDGNFRDLTAVLLILAGIVVVWSQAGRTANFRSPVFIVSVLSGLASLVCGLVLLFFVEDSVGALLRGGIIGAILIVGVVIAFTPLWLRASREHTDSELQQARDAERAEIAAHLHDSVLQTLTLIRAASEDATRVRSLALAQERELRSWLYTDRSTAADSLEQALRDALDQVEATHGTPVELVCVGDMRPESGELALVAACAEAATNAVRHGAPPVSVYAEVSREAVDIFVKDRGAGFAIETIPEDRHGVRGSIIGRVERVGGEARFRRLNPGTEVHLRIGRTALSSPREDRSEEHADQYPRNPFTSRKGQP